MPSSVACLYTPNKTPTHNARTAPSTHPLPHRLSEKGLLSDIVEEWEEWQHDQMLKELQAHNKSLQPRQARKHKRDEAEVDPEAPRQVSLAGHVLRAHVLCGGALMSVTCGFYLKDSCVFYLKISQTSTWGVGGTFEV